MDEEIIDPIRVAKAEKADVVVERIRKGLDAVTGEPVGLVE